MSVLKTRGVPKRTEALLQSLGADPELADDILGDLAEEFAVRRQWDGTTAARRWYYREALRTAPHLLRDWRRRFRFGEAAPLAGALLAGIVVDAFVARALTGLVWSLAGTPLVAQVREGSLTGGLVAWLVMIVAARQIIPGMAAGFVAGTIGKRAALPFSMVTSAAILALVASRVMWQGTSAGALAVVVAVNAGLLVTSCLAGGMAAALRLRRPNSDAARAP